MTKLSSLRLNVLLVIISVKIITYSVWLAEIKLWINYRDCQCLWNFQDFSDKVPKIWNSLQYIDQCKNRIDTGCKKKILDNLPCGKRKSFSLQEKFSREHSWSFLEMASNPKLTFLSGLKKKNYRRGRFWNYHIIICFSGCTAKYIADKNMKFGGLKEKSKVNTLILI